MDSFGLSKIQQKLERTKRDLLVKLSNQAATYFSKSFKNQGFDGSPWAEVQRRQEGADPWKYPKSKGLQRRTSPILVGAGYGVRGGTLRRAVSNMRRTAQFTGKMKITMSVNVPYAEFLNEGTDNMPQRQFVGQTARLTKMQNRTIVKVVDNIWGK